MASSLYLPTRIASSSCFSQRRQACFQQPTKPSALFHPLTNRRSPSSFKLAVGASKSSRIQCSHVRDVNTEELDHLVTGERETPLVIDFCADWCGSCDILSEQLEELAEEYDGRVRFVQVNTDQEYDLADQLEIRGLPTMVFMGRHSPKLTLSPALPLRFAHLSRAHGAAPSHAAPSAHAVRTRQVMPVTLKVAGSWSGQVEIPSLTEWTVCELRAELSRLSGIDAGSLKIICGGRTLKDEAEAEGEAEGERGRAGGASTGAEETVAEGNTGDVGKGNSEGNGEGEKGEGKGMGNALGKRKGGRGRSLEEVGVRAGSRLLVTGGGRRLGGEIAAEGKRVVEEEAARKEREERLARVRAAAAFSICDAKITESIDNIPMLLLDIVWCHYMTKNVASLASAKGRLAAARSALRKAHGADMSRLRLLQGNFRPELATYLRLDLLDAIAAYHSGDLTRARPLLASAQSLFQQLQVSDESLASLAGMGFSANEARRALRVAGGDVSRAAEFVILQRQREAEKAEEDRRQRRMEREQRAYGRTPRGKKVDMRLLDELAAYGFTRRVAAEALRQSENHHQSALDALLDPNSLAALEVAVAEGKADGGRRRHSRGGGGAGAGGAGAGGAGGTCSDDSVAALVALGFSAHQARRALEGSSNDVEAAAAALLQGEYGEAGTGEGGGSGEGGEGEEGNGAGERGAGEEGIEGTGGAGGMDVDGGEGSEGGSEGSEEEEERDEEMEGEIRKGVSGDPYAEYDLDVPSKITPNAAHPSMPPISASITAPLSAPTSSPSSPPCRPPPRPRSPRSAPPLHPSIFASITAPLTSSPSSSAPRHRPPHPTSPHPAPPAHPSISASITAPFTRPTFTFIFLSTALSALASAAAPHPLSPHSAPPAHPSISASITAPFTRPTFTFIFPFSFLSTALSALASAAALAPPTSSPSSMATAIAFSLAACSATDAESVERGLGRVRDGSAASAAGAFTR
ncbi:unnamed protein product [Closterium sp. Naga37s-1]|nr:unnamed protein product [Closterium sp. Naga37s-1]